MSILKDLILNISFFNKKTNMEKEIYEQSSIIKHIVRKYIKQKLIVNIDTPDNIKKIIFIASGSSYHSAAIASFFFNKIKGIEALYYYSSEFVLHNSIEADNDVLFVFISQSGETSDTNKALSLIKSKTQNTLALTNTKNSSLYNNANYKILTYAGEEKSIASTKAFGTQLFCLFLLAAKIMQEKNISSSNLIEELINLPKIVKKAFVKRNSVFNIAKRIFEYENIVLLSTGLYYPLAREGALKIKETSYINTSAYPMGEFLHGHIALLNKKSAVLVLCDYDSSSFTENVIDIIRKNYSADCYIFTNDLQFNYNKENILYLPETNKIYLLFTYMVLLQLLALDIAMLLKKDVDNPKGLRKVVK